MSRAAPRIPRAMTEHKRRPNERLRPQHREFVQSLPCIACGKPAPSECAHIRTGTDAGTGLKPSDRFCLPLCGPFGCHHNQHQVGEAEFFGRLGIDALDYAARLWAVTGDREAGLRCIFRARQSIALHRNEHG